MARWSKKTPEPEPEEQPRSLVASAARLHWDAGTGLKTWRFGDDAWQQDAWRLYDVIGELRFIANWIGAACSKVRVYVAKVDDNGRIQKEATGKIGGLADTLFNGPSGLAEALRLMGINLTIAGDVYVVGRGSGDGDPMSKDDDWMVVSCSELKRWGPGSQDIAWMYGDKKTERLALDPEKDLIIRIWTPHPRRTLWADSPTRGAMPMLFEIERLTRYVFSQIDSRLFSAGLFPVPREMSFPDDDGNEITGAEALTDKLMRVGSLSLRGEGTAAGVVPTFVEVPLEALGKLELIPFASELSKQALDLRQEALRRLALAMDIDPSILTGMGDANHWGAWQIFEGQVKIHIEPLMTRICDGLTTAYLQPALKALGEDPDRFIYWFDTAPLTVRPERLKETREMYDAGLVSKSTVLLAGDYAISDAPSDEESAQKFIRELMLRDPNLFANPAVRTAAGIPNELLPATTVIAPPGQGAGPPPPPAPPTGISDTPGAPLPVDSQAQNALPGPGGEAGVPAGTPTGLTAAAATFSIANATVLRALDRAGKKMLTRQTVGQFPAVPSHELHTVLPGKTYEQVTQLLEGSWDQMSVLAEYVAPEEDIPKLRRALEGYCAALLIHQQPHSSALLADWLQQRGIFHGDA